VKQRAFDKLTGVNSSPFALSLSKDQAELAEA
jgi:hypothetical protein